MAVQIWCMTHKFNTWKLESFQNTDLLFHVIFFHQFVHLSVVCLYVHMFTSSVYTDVEKLPEASNCWVTEDAVASSSCRFHSTWHGTRNALSPRAGWQRGEQVKSLKGYLLLWEALLYSGRGTGQEKGYRCCSRQTRGQLLIRLSLCSILSQLLIFLGSEWKSCCFFLLLEVYVSDV